MNNFLIFFLIIVLLVIFYLSGSISFYTQTPANTNFKGSNDLIGFNSSGDIILVPVGNINSGIDTAVRGTTDSLNNDLSRLRTDVYNNKTGIQRLNAGIDTKADRASLRSYVKKGQKYKIYNNDGNQILLKWGSDIKADGNTNSTENYRYFNIND
jgi:hypothetical protein